MYNIIYTYTIPTAPPSMVSGGQPATLSLWQSQSQRSIIPNFARSWLYQHALFKVNSWIMFIFMFCYIYTIDHEDALTS